MLHLLCNMSAFDLIKTHDLSPESSHNVDTEEERTLWASLNLSTEALGQSMHAPKINYCARARKHH